MGLITYENLEDGQKVTANIFNERFAQIVAQINGQLDENNLKDDGISKAKLKAEVYESMYPIGSQYVNFTDNTNPATLLGFGTWQQIVGRVIVGYDATQNEFNAAGKTGGHKLMQAHVHRGGYVDYNAGKPAYQPDATWATLLRNSGSQAAGYNVDTGSTGGGDGENMPPYVVAYVWKRVS